MSKLKKKLKIVFKWFFIKILIWFFFVCFTYSIQVDINLSIKNSFVWTLELDWTQVTYSGWKYYTTLSWIDLHIWANTWNISYLITWDFVPSPFTWAWVWSFTNIKWINFWNLTWEKKLYIKFYRDRNSGTYIEETDFKIVNFVYYSTWFISTWNQTSIWWWWNMLESLFDRCPNWDNSPSYYDWRCGDETYHNVDGTDWNIKELSYQDELQQALDYAYRVWMVTHWNFYKARLNDKIKRKELAKIITIFAIKIMWKQPNLKKDCNFNDITWESLELQWYMKLSCELDIMWIIHDETRMISFYPNQYVNRAQFGTVISRLLFGSKYNRPPWVWWYKEHLNALNENWIMKKIDVPSMDELRWFVLIMLKRTDDKYYLDEFLDKFVNE